MDISDAAGLVQSRAEMEKTEPTFLKNQTIVGFAANKKTGNRFIIFFKFC